jgi:DNA-binding transcriptional MerR regulator
MAESPAPVDIPRRTLFKAGEVCELMNVQPYVLRSWESEFPDLGVAKTAGGPRVYRREDVEQVARIKHLLLVEGLTLAGARRRLEEESTPVAPDVPVIDELIGRHARERLTEVKRGLRSILDLLSGRGAGADFRLVQPGPTGSARRGPSGRSRRMKGGPPGSRSSAAVRRKR